MKLLATEDLLKGSVGTPVDVFSYHFYGGASERCGEMSKTATTSADAAMGEDWLSRTGRVEAFYAGLRDRFYPGKPMWVTETGQTGCGGDRWASTFLDTFRYVDQMGQLAKRNVKVIMHNTLDASDYALIDNRTMTPRPNYWAALLWHKTMGTTVLDAGATKAGPVHVYAACMKDHPGGVTMVALNLGRTEPAIDVPERSLRYTLTANELMGSEVQLNGTVLKVLASGDVPVLMGVATAKEKVMLPTASITFLTIADAGNSSCR